MAFKKLKLWFDDELAERLAGDVSEALPQFAVKNFIKETVEPLDDLELKARVEWFADMYHKFLPGPYSKNIDILLKTVGPENPEETGMFTEFYWLMPMAKYIEKYGLSSFAKSMKAIEVVTKRNTSEYAIRPFIEKYPQKSMIQLNRWAKDSNFHVRRLASEGCRPRLPWASKLQAFIDDPSPVLSILEVLKDDKSKYVQNSVANSVNDILKDNFEIGQTLLRRWQKSPGPERKWIIKHAIRNFRKKEVPWALKMMKSLS